MKYEEIKKHLRGDMKMFHHEAEEDMDLMKKLNKAKKVSKKKVAKKGRKKMMKRKGAEKVEKVMHEFKEGVLHSGSKKGPKVKSRKQAIAIALSEARRMKSKKK